MSQFRLSNVTVRYMCMVTLLESKEGKGLKLSSHFFHIYICVCVHMHVVKAEMMTGTPTASATIKVKGQKQVTVLSFNYLGSSVSSDGLKSEVLSTVVQATQGSLNQNLSGMVIFLSVPELGKFSPWKSYTQVRLVF